MQIDEKIPINPEKDSSFWYHGNLYSATDGNREALIIATGDIKIVNKEGEDVYRDHRIVGPGFPEFEGRMPNNDKELESIDHLGYGWIMNNWFEVVTYVNDYFDASVVFHSYSEARERLLELFIPIRSV